MGGKYFMLIFNLHIINTRLLFHIQVASRVNKTVAFKIVCQFRDVKLGVNVNQVQNGSLFSDSSQIRFLRRVSGIKKLIKMSTYRLACGDSEITWENNESFHIPV